MNRRKSIGIKTVSIIGYTNAGKSSLFNLLTKKQNMVKNALFVTLDSTMGKLYLPRIKQEVTISDTIGFIKNLPTTLINTFKSTLMESIHADLLLHVLDISDPELENKIEVVEQILSELKIIQNKRIFVFNKLDCLDKSSLSLIRRLKNNYAQHIPQFISATLQVGIDELKFAIESQLFPVK